MGAPPRNLDINGRPWALKAQAAGRMRGAAGLCHYDKARIDYQTRMLPVERRDTVLHEVMHALLYTQGREYGGEVEETYVRALASGLIGVLDANPEFADWLITKD